MALSGSYHKKGADYVLSLIVIMVILAVLALAAYFYYYLPSKKPIMPYYQDDPSTWVEDTADSAKEINIDKITKGDSFIDTNGQQYITKDIGTVFSYNGWYKGRQFRREYAEQKDNSKNNIGSKDKSKKIMMRISQEMSPKDGVIEGFVVEKLKDNKAILYIFLDDDWKNKVFETKIYYGAEFQLQKEFDFSNEIKEGIYMNEVLDDPERFENNYATHAGGVYVGELREDGNSTVIFFT